MDAPTESSKKTAVERASEWFGFVLGVLAILLGIAALVAAVVMVAKLAASGHIKPGTNPLETLFASRLMIATVRIGILVFVLYAVFSMLLYMRRGQPLSRVGPVQVSESVRAVKTEADALQEALNEALAETARLEGEIADLGERLEASDRYLDSVLELLEQNAETGEQPKEAQ